MHGGAKVRHVDSIQDDDGVFTQYGRMKPRSDRNATPVPPGPPSRLWGANHLRKMQWDYLGFVTDLQRDYGDVVQLQIFRQSITHVFHPELIREVLVDQADRLIRWERATEVFSVAMGQSVLVTEGALWQRQRRMLQPGFTPKRVAGYAELMAAATRQAFNALTPGPAGLQVDIDALMTRVTLDVILRALFGHHQTMDSRPIAQAIQTLSRAAFEQLINPLSFPLWMPLPSMYRVRNALTTLNQFIAQHIEAQQRAGNDDGDDLLTMLRLVRDPEHPEQGLSVQELRDQAMLTFQAGHETSATALTWWCGMMARHPDVAQCIRAEVDAVLQGRLPTPETLQQLPWLQASLKETLRLCPPVPLMMTRRASQDVRVGPWTVPRGGMIALSPYVIQRDARWFDRAEDFKPERFLPNAPDIVRGAWLPFGTGPRVCIGQHFALLEMGLIAAMLMQRFTLHMPRGMAWPQGQLAVSYRPERMVLNLMARSSPLTA